MFKIIIAKYATLAYLFIAGLFAVGYFIGKAYYAFKKALSPKTK